jgi:hypothetical protein
MEFRPSLFDLIQQLPVTQQHIAKVFALKKKQCGNAVAGRTREEAAVMY